jgi:hypothetical protein
MASSIGNKQIVIGVAVLGLLALALLGVIPSPLPTLTSSNRTSIEIEDGATGRATLLMPATGGDIELSIPSDLVELAPRGNIIAQRPTPAGYTALVKGCNLGCDVEFNLRAGASGSIEIKYPEGDGDAAEGVTVRYG